MSTPDSTRLSGDAYRTRIAANAPVPTDNKTRLAQEGGDSKLARDAADVRPDANEFYKVGEKIGDRYEVSAIHHGAMGVVYGCFDHQTKLPRALKTVRARYAKDKQVLAMFESEAAVWISLEKHPNIVHAYLVEIFGNLPYVITEYVRGPAGMEGDLRGWLGSTRLTLPIAVSMALQIAQGMQHAVRKIPNLVHRDLKPANILVNVDGKPLVTDFGLVRVVKSGVGTPAYMSPEQFESGEIDGRSDIYAYGCILFEMFTAHRLFPAVTEYEWEQAHLKSIPPHLTSIVPGLPREIDRFVSQCLDKNVGARPQSWDAVVAFFAEWYHRLTGNAVILDFSSLALDAAEWLTASYSLCNLNRYSEMLLACDQAIKIDSKNAAIWTNKSVALTGLCDHDSALRAAENAICLDSNFTPAWDSKGCALCGLKRYDEALAAYQKVLVVDANNAITLSNKSNALISLNRNEEAVAACHKALAVEPNLANAWFNMSCALRNLDRHEESLMAYEKAFRFDANISSWLGKGWLYLTLNKFDEAIRAYDRALEIDPTSLPAWCNRGMALSRLQRNVEAMQAFDQALVIDPENLAARAGKFAAQGNFVRSEAALAVRKPISFWSRHFGK